MEGELDAEFLATLQLLETVVPTLRRDQRVRVDRWLDFLCQPVHTANGRRNRNQYAVLLADQALRRTLEAPFLKLPSGRSLPNFPSRKRVALADAKRRLRRQLCSAPLLAPAATLLRHLDVTATASSGEAFQLPLSPIAARVDNEQSCGSNSSYDEELDETLRAWSPSRRKLFRWDSGAEDAKAENEAKRRGDYEDEPISQRVREARDGNSFRIELSEVPLSTAGSRQEVDDAGTPETTTGLKVLVIELRQTIKGLLEQLEIERKGHEEELSSLRGRHNDELTSLQKWLGARMDNLESLPTSDAAHCDGAASVKEDLTTAARERTVPKENDQQKANSAKKDSQVDEFLKYVKRCHSDSEKLVRDTKARFGPSTSTDGSWATPVRRKGRRRRSSDNAPTGRRSRDDWYVAQDGSAPTWGRASSRRESQPGSEREDGILSSPRMASVREKLLLGAQSVASLVRLLDSNFASDPFESTTHDRFLNHDGVFTRNKLGDGSVRRRPRSKR